MKQYLLAIITILLLPVQSFSAQYSYEARGKLVSNIESSFESETTKPVIGILSEDGDLEEAYLLEGETPQLLRRFSGEEVSAELLLSDESVRPSLINIAFFLNSKQVEYWSDTSRNIFNDNLASFRNTTDTEMISGKLLFDEKTVTQSTSGFILQTSTEEKKIMHVDRKLHYTLKQMKGQVVTLIVKSFKEQEEVSIAGEVARSVLSFVERMSSMGLGSLNTLRGETFNNEKVVVDKDTVLVEGILHSTQDQYITGFTNTVWEKDRYQLMVSIPTGEVVANEDGSERIIYDDYKFELPLDGRRNFQARDLADALVEVRFKELIGRDGRIKFVEGLKLIKPAPSEEHNNIQFP